MTGTMLDALLLDGLVKPNERTWFDHKVERAFRPKDLLVARFESELLICQILVGAHQIFKNDKGITAACFWFPGKWPIRWPICEQDHSLKVLVYNPTLTALRFEARFLGVFT